MLVTYDRFLKEYKRGKPGALLTYNACAVNGLWCNVCRKVAQSMDELGKALAIALLSLVFFTACAAPTVTYTYETRMSFELAAQHMDTLAFDRVMERHLSDGWHVVMSVERAHAE